jgi:hypothetical protein
LLLFFKKHFLKIKALRAQWTSVQHASDALPNSRGPPRLRSSGGWRHGHLRSLDAISTWKAR